MQKETKRNLVTASLLIATFLMAIEGTIVSTAMPKIVNDLGGSHLYTWVISIYLLSTVISSPIFGKMADLYGRKLMFNIGVVIFLIGSMLSGLSQTMEQLIIFRFIQGIGAGALATIPMTIVGDVFPLEQRAKVQGMISSIWGISGIIGPLVGGFIVDIISWHWIFYMNLPFGIVSLFLLHHSLHEQLGDEKQSIDYPGIFVFAVGMGSFLYAINLMNEGEIFTGRLMILLAITLLSFFLFLWIENRAKVPMLPLGLFKNKMIVISYSVLFLFGFILVTVSFYIPLWVQGVTRLNATLSGIAMLPMSISWPFGAMLLGRWIHRRSPLKNALIGLTIILIGTIGFNLFQMETTIPRMMINTAMIGVGFGITSTLFTVIVQSSVEWNLRGVAMGSMSLIRNLGQTIGIAVSGLLLTEELQGEMLARSLKQIFFLIMMLAILAMIIASFLKGKKINQNS